VLFDTPTQTWIRQTAGVNTVLNRGVGYSFICLNSGTLDLTGPYSQPGTAYVSSGTAAAVGANILVGNPYLADVDWELVTRTNTDATIYYWNGASKSYASYTAGTAISTNGGTRYIPVLQSAFVSATNTGAFSVSIDRSMIKNSSPLTSYFKTAALNELVKLNVSNTSGLSDDVALVINNDATNGFDGNYDAYKLMNPATSLNLYSTLGGVNYAVNSIPSSTTGQEIPLNFKAPVDGQYTITVTDLNLNTTSGELKDLQTGISYPLAGLNHTFNALKADATNRFVVVLGANASLSTVASSTKNAGISFGSNQSTVFVESSKTTIDNATIQLVDVTGNVVRSSNSNIKIGTNMLSMDGVKSGMYVVKIIDNNTSSVYTGSVAIQ
jgi:hypothetical protein